ncbi:MAG TPA: ABC transporter ATP-binding protein [Verrucomicrobiae bacterium]|jgi:subfamily B ATP-binding cassette protein MsbA
MNYLAKVFRFGWPYLRRYRSRLVCGLLLGVLFGLTNVSFVWAIRTITERLSPIAADAAPSASAGVAVPATLQELQQKAGSWLDAWLPLHGRKTDWRQIAGGLLLLPVLLGLRGFTGYLSSYCLAWVSERVINDLRVDVVSRLSSLSLDFFNRSKLGDLITRINTDTASLQRTLSEGASDLVKEPVTIVAILSYLFFRSWKLTLFAVVFLPICMLPLIVLGKKARRAGKAGREADVQQANLIIEFLSGIRVVKAFSLEGQQIERFRNYSRELVRHTMKGVQAREQINPIIESIAAFGLGALLVYVFLAGETVPGLVTFIASVFLIYTPVRKLTRLHVLFQQTSSGVERLMQVLGEQPSVRELALPRHVKTFESAIEFQDVNFSYGHHTILHHISLRIPRGQKLGIAGESGSGKSTLVNLLFRFYDTTHGKILFDGHDLREFSLSDLRHQMALVSQEIVIFDQTVADNIACGKIGASPQEIEAAARAAHADEFIRQLPHGYQTMVGERGVNLSGGQRQRIAIARAFIRNAPILALDEATAALDSQSEAEVQAAIEDLEHDRTVICVAHRLSTLAKMDKIIVLSHGRVVEEGSFAELLQFGGIFADMARRQGIFAPVAAK